MVKVGGGVVVIIREANKQDLEFILDIYNQGIEDRVATLESETKDLQFMTKWYEQHNGRYKVVVAEQDEQILGWCSLNPYNNRCAYAGVADLSIYIARECRGRGIGSLLITGIENLAIENDFHKIVLFTFPFNRLGQGLYHKMGYQEVGIFHNQGILDGRYIDVMAMEKQLFKQNKEI